MLMHHDNRLNFDLAETSQVVAQAAKDDSTSMRTLALLSTVFLPGTFISVSSRASYMPTLSTDGPHKALFSTTMFDWKAQPGASVVSHRFWIYWAFTVPITLLVFAGCMIWLREEKNRDQRHIRAKYQIVRRGTGDLQHGQPERAPTSGFKVSALRLKRRFKSQKKFQENV